MIKTIVGCLLILACFVLINCGGDKARSRNEVLEKEVMDIHNKVMPKMGEVARLKDDLEKKKATLDSLSSTEVKEIDDLLIELSEANNGMMEWMRNYSGEFDEMNDNEKGEYLRQQKDKISEVQDRINRAIEAAEKELKK